MDCHFLHNHTEKKGDIKLGLEKSRLNTIYEYFYLEFHQRNGNRSDLKLSWIKFKKHSYIFNSTFNVQHFTDNKSDIKLGLLKSRQSTVYAYFYLELHQMNGRLAPSLFRDMSALRNIVTSAAA